MIILTWRMTKDRTAAGQGLCYATSLSFSLSRCLFLFELLYLHSSQPIQTLFLQYVSYKKKITNKIWKFSLVFKDLKLMLSLIIVKLLINTT
jgi:hypothetical protein